MATPPVITRAVLLDLDDTLFDHAYCTAEALLALRAVTAGWQRWDPAELIRRHAELLEQFHVEVLAGRLTVDEARIRRFQRLSLDAGAAVTREGAEAIAADYRRAYVSNWRPVPGALELLDAIHPRAPIGLISNNVVGEQLEKITQCGFAPYLDTIVISEEAGVSKPAPRIFAIALARLGTTADETVMVGDSWAADILGARSAGLRAVWFNRAGTPPPDPGMDGVSEIRSLEPAGAVVRLVFGTE